MIVRNISQARAELSALLAEVQRGGEVILVKAGKPVARIIPYQGPVKLRKPGALAGKIWMAEDFDDLPDDTAESFGMTVREK